MLTSRLPFCPPALIHKPLPKRCQVLVAAGLVLALTTSARAQATKVQAAPIAFHNKTNMTLIVEGVSYIDGLGALRTMGAVGKPLAWSFKPGENLYLQDNGNKIYATKFTGKVHGSGKVSEWFWTSNGPDAGGYFTTMFTPDNLRHHLGEKVVVQQPPPLLPQPQGPTQQQQQAAVAKIFVAVLAHAAADKVVKDAGNNANFFQIAAVVSPPDPETIQRHPGVDQQRHRWPAQLPK